jgi:hypothetical protein
MPARLAPDVRPPGLAGRAAAAADLADRISAHADPGEADPGRSAYRRRLARTLSVLVGVDPAHVVVVDDPDRYYGHWPGFLAVIAEPDHTWRLITAPGNDDTYLLLAPCPSCAGETPAVAIAELADLGRWLRTSPCSRPARPREFTTDPGHDANCPHRDHAS